jgi:transcriptional regulator GlxA family with amidase domain
MTAGPRHIEVLVVAPPRALLLDIAGPIEVLRKANLTQDAVRFVPRYVGAGARVATSIGLDVAGLAPLPARVAAGAFVLVSGSADEPMGEGRDAADEARQEAEIVDWLARVVRPGVRLMTICSGALLAARAGLFENVECTTHHACVEALRRLASTTERRGSETDHVRRSPWAKTSRSMPRVEPKGAAELPRRAAVGGVRDVVAGGWLALSLGACRTARGRGSPS